MLHAWCDPFDRGHTRLVVLERSNGDAGNAVSFVTAPDFEAPGFGCWQHEQLQFLGDGVCDGIR